MNTEIQIFYAFASFTMGAAFVYIIVSLIKKL